MTLTEYVFRNRTKSFKELMTMLLSCIDITVETHVKNSCTNWVLSESCLGNSMCHAFSISLNNFAQSGIHLKEGEDVQVWF